MKKFRCPLCGSNFGLQSDLYCYDHHVEGYEPVYYFLCEDCSLNTTFVRSEEDAIEEAEMLISMFPPLWRVRPGDKLQVEDGSICEVINVNKNLAMMDVRRGEGRPVFTIADTHVIRWPWKLEQEEDAE